MSTWMNTIGLCLLALTVPGTLYLFTLTWAALLPKRARSATPMAGQVAIVVPAHNEAQGIRPCLDSLKAAAAVDGHTAVVVVADNCTDNTAAMARQQQVQVLERHDPANRGKGHALHHAFSSLAGQGYAAFVVIDADSAVTPDFVSKLRSAFGAGACALQTRYTVLNAQDSPRTRLAALALAAFNVLRPRGRDRLGLSAGILGNGFALRQEVLTQVPYTASSVVEDLEYHLRLLNAGVRVHFVDDAEVRGEMPANQAGQAQQRARWEGGRLRMLKEAGPGLLLGLVRGRWHLLEPLADLLLLPLALHSMLLALAAICLFGSPSPVLAGTSVALFSLAALLGHVLAAVHIGRLPWSSMLVLVQLPAYLLWKLRMTGAILATSRRQSAWVRTTRNDS